MRSYTLFMLSFILFICACKQDESQDLFEIYHDDTIQFHDLIQLDDQIICVGGNLWESGIALYVNLSQGEVDSTVQVSTRSLLSIENKSDQKLIAVGLANTQNCYDSQVWSEVSLDSSFIRRGLCFIDDSSIVVGGQAFFKGYIEILDDQGQQVQLQQFPHQLNAIVDFSNNHLLAVGFGAIYTSVDEGRNWTLLDIEGDNFLSIAYDLDRDMAFVLGETGLTYSFDNNLEPNLLSQGSLVSNAYREIIFHQNILYRAGQEGLLEYSESTNIDWNRLEIDTGEEINAMYAASDELFLLTNSGSVFRMNI